MKSNKLSAKNLHVSSDSEDSGASDNEVPMSTFSARLLEREKELLRQNQQVKNETNLVVKKIQESVEMTKLILSKPGARKENSPAVQTSEKSTTRTTSQSSSETLQSSAKKTSRSFENVRGVGDMKILDESAASLPTLTLETNNRLLKAKLDVVTQEMDKVVKDRLAKDNKVREQQDVIKQLTEENKMHAKTIQTLQHIADKSKKMNVDLKGKIELLESQATHIKKEFEALQKSRKNDEADVSSREVKLNKALEELERSKQTQKVLVTDYAAKLAALAATNDSLATENKKLQKQKTDLITMFQKQKQLIDVLKRQKIHIASAKLLEFSEEEFIRSLNLAPTA